MTPADAAKVLTLVATYDNRTFSHATAVVWADALEHLQLDDCLTAVRRHFRQSKEWLMPSDIRGLVRAVLIERKQADVRAQYAANDQSTAIEAAPDDEAKAAARRAEIARLIADASRMPQLDNPHPAADARLELAARRIACPWCGATPGEACTNTATKQRSKTTHPKRLTAAMQHA